ncbi:MAG: hypothetical protein GTN81_02130 [Proteobacteria bacterium]|nr:hypothetical protein [Pseudomonadota bacterium]
MSQDPKREGENYRIVFLGVTDPSDANIQAFSEKLSRQFQIPTEKALRIIRSAPMVIKKNVPRAKAERYQQFFMSLGGQVRIERMDGGTEGQPVRVATSKVDGLETTAIGPQGTTEKSPDLVQPGSDSTAKAYDDAIASAYEEGFTPPTPGLTKSSGPPGFVCPQCGEAQQKAVECVKCGVIFEKYERLAEAAEPAEAEVYEENGEVEPIPRDMEVKIEHAGFWIRAGAYIIDNVLLIFAFLGLAIALFLIFGAFRNPSVIVVLQPLLILVSIVMPFAYSVYYLGKRGYTPGKGFLGLQVIRQDGTGMTYGDAAIRTFSYILSLIPMNLGFLWVAFDPNKEGWHDKIAKTQVIKAEEVPAWRKWVALLPVILVPVLGIVAAISVQVHMKYSSRADVIKAWSDMQTVKTHLEEHYYRYERYPSTGEFQSFLVSSLGRIPSDPFNNQRPYRYQSDGYTFTLWSIGPDRQDNHAMIRYEPSNSRGFAHKGDIILTSDPEIDEGEELFETMPDGSDPGDEILSITPSRL